MTGTVRAADDADGAGFTGIKAKQLRADEGDEDTQLRGRAHQKCGGVGDQGSEVRHRADAHEDQRRVDAQLYALVQVVQQAAVGGLDAVAHGVGHFVQTIGNLSHIVAGRHGRGLRGFQRIEEGIAGVAHQTREGQVGQQHTEGNRHEQQRLKLLHDSQIQQQAGDGDHHVLTPGASREAGRLGDFHDAIPEVDFGILVFGRKFGCRLGVLRGGRFRRNGFGYLGRGCVRLARGEVFRKR